MVTISKKTEYAIMLVFYLSDTKGKYISLTEVCRELALPYRFLGQLAVGLKNGGLLKAREGRGGGYGLAKDWQGVSLYDLIVMLGEDKALVKCLCDGDNCVCSRQAKCKLKKLWARLEGVFREEIKRVKLGEIEV